ncbi:YbaB/EbfC family nucleoid-associated protein [Tsukamurella paurometabola]|uniref:Uncharacterized BCR, YbaB family COG0718 n=1 Tax=Tsukamurella paurometabola TaxID=2061 RepID=A0A3P8L796_TSUPA|nr:YbaB/EbfC family nucleoid-associated protein [Tsukamurella paurometabola]UEA82264.1 YbaB/EbfC family nucleoid-associated protein [Tsukamurella paurometabola]VDR39311.1 Uncharacterised BCR, YbaB family COG0718 [Tsukamurella paurometabola]
MTEYLASMAQQLEEHAAALRAARAESAGLTAEARSTDRAVTVRVRVDGTVVQVTLHGESERMDRMQLGASIAQATNAALARVDALAARRLAAGMQATSVARRQLVDELQRQENPLGVALDRLVTAAAAVPPAVVSPDPPPSGATAAPRRTDRYRAAALEEAPQGWLTR